MVARHLVTAVYFLAGGSSGISAWWIGLAGSQLSKSWTALISSDICRLFSISRKVSFRTKLTRPNCGDGRLEPALWKLGEYSTAWYDLSPSEAYGMPFLLSIVVSLRPLPNSILCVISSLLVFVAL